MILTMISNLPWASSLIASCFSCFTVKILKDFHVMAVTREGSGLVPLKGIPTGTTTQLANAAMLITPVITVLGLWVQYPWLYWIISFFLVFCSRTSILLRKYASVWDNFFKRYYCGSFGAVGFKSEYISVSLSYIVILYSIVGDKTSLG